MTEKNQKQPRQRPNCWTGSIPKDLQKFAKERAEELNMEGGASELVRRLLIAELIRKNKITNGTHKTSIAERAPRGIPRTMLATAEAS